jgi:hypothetical protein
VATIVYCEVRAQIVIVDKPFRLSTAGEVAANYTELADRPDNAWLVTRGLKFSRAQTPTSGSGP